MAESKGVYIYGVIQDHEERRWSLPGVGGAQTVYTICQGALSAIVSDGSTEVYEATQEHLLSHNKVLEEILKAFWVLPLRLGTVATDAIDVKTFLHKAAHVLREALAQIEAKAEFDVEAQWHGDGIFRLIAEENEKIKEHKARMAAGKTVGRDEQIALGMMVAEAISQRTAQVAQEIEAELKALSNQARPLKASTKETVFNAALLVDQERWKPFEEAIYRLGDRFGKLLKFRYAGPLPCYSFVNLQVMMVDFRAVDEARKTLELGDSANLSQIKEAYRRLAVQYHPDRNPNDPTAKERFEKLQVNYQLLLGYCETVAEESSQVIPLTEGTVGKTTVVVSQERLPDVVNV